MELPLQILSLRNDFVERFAQTELSGILLDLLNLFEEVLDLSVQKTLQSESFLDLRVSHWLFVPAHHFVIDVQLNYELVRKMVRDVLRLCTFKKLFYHLFDSPLRIKLGASLVLRRILNL